VVSLISVWSLVIIFTRRLFIHLACCHLRHSLKFGSWFVSCFHLNATSRTYRLYMATHMRELSFEPSDLSTEVNSLNSCVADSSSWRSGNFLTLHAEKANCYRASRQTSASRVLLCRGFARIHLIALSPFNAMVVHPFVLLPEAFLKNSFFCIHMRSLELILQGHDISYHFDADDTQLHLSFNPSDLSTESTG